MANHSDRNSSSATARPDEMWRRVSDHALRSSEHFVDGLIEANRAFAASFGASTADGEGDTGSGAEAEAEVPSAAADELAYTQSDWSFERTTDDRGDLGVGDAVQFTKRLSDDDVRSFARISGDTNRLHLDEEFAEQTRFGGRIVHGGLLSGLISAALARLPGLTIYLSQSLDFHAPADVGDTFVADCEIVEDLGDDRYRLETVVRDDEENTIIEGEAVVLIDELPDEEGDD